MQRRMAIWDRNQQAMVDIPFVSGNAIRGYLRRLLVADFLELVNYRAMTPKLHHALYSGGQLEASDDGMLDMKLRRQLLAALPPIGLLGTSIGNQILTSCLSVEHALPICQERQWTREVRPPRSYDTDPRWDQPCRMFVDEHFQTRRDDLHEERDEDEQAQQMLVQYECLVPGTLLEHGFVLRNASEAERGALGRALQLWAQFPVIGGKSSGGFGRIALQYDHVPDPEPYLVFCRDHADDAVEALNAIALSAPALKQSRKAKGEEE